jgi:UDP-GlcNAc:undecaprenyl-phosphate/decaprenyl-phosphate GlcNAc-1-phosphate transferase
LTLFGPGEPVRDYFLTLLVAAAVSYLLTPLVRRLAARIGAMKEPRDRDVHVAPVPLIGGLAMYGGLVAGLLVASQIPQVRSGIAGTGMVPGLLLAGGLLVAIGIVDDRWGMSALTKGAGQIAAGGILVATGTQLYWLPEPRGGTFVPTTAQSTVLTILIVVATINAVNFIDGLDGLAAGIVCIAAISFFAYYYSLTRVIHESALAAPALASAILIGMCLGFLPHNFSPANVFMGDTGAMLLGLLLAYAPISGINSLDPAVLANQINRYPEIMPLLLPAALLVIPYGDLLLAVVRRTRAGRSPFAPDRKHLHHRLLDIGHSQRASVLIMYLWAAMFSGIVVWLSIDKTEQPGAANHHGVPVFVLVGVTAAAVAALLLMSMPRLRWWERKSRPQASRGRAATASSAAALLPAPTEQAGAAATQPAGRAGRRSQHAAAPDRSGEPGQSGESDRSGEPEPASDLVTLASAAVRGGWAEPVVGPEPSRPDHRVARDLAAGPGHRAEPDDGPDLHYGMTAPPGPGPDRIGRTAPRHGVRPAAPGSVPADVTSPDLIRSWHARTDRPGGGATRSVIGTVPPAITASGGTGNGHGRADPLPWRAPGGARHDAAQPDPAGTQIDWFGNSRGADS